MRMNVDRSPLVAWAQSMIPPASEDSVVSCLPRNMEEQPFVRNVKAVAPFQPPADGNNTIIISLSVDCLMRLGG
jgi:hypothetical protein